MKKISAVILILIIFNFICLESSVYATSDDTSSGVYQDMQEYLKQNDEGVTNINGEERKISLGDSDIGSASSKLGSFFATIASAVNKVTSTFSLNGGIYRYEGSNYSADKTGLFTINSLVFGEYVIFNAEASQTSADLRADADDNYTAEGINKSIDDIKIKGASISKVITGVALIIAGPMTLYALFRILASGKAKDLAAWKKIFARWFLCFILIFMYQLIFVFIDSVADSLVDSFWDIRIKLEENGYTPFESSVIEDVSTQIENTGGVTSLAYSILYTGFVVMETLFLAKYTIRTFGIIILSIVAPLIILLHSIKLMIGKNSDMLGEFFKIYLVLVFMQPLHAMFYLIFMFSLSEMIIKVPLLGIVLLYALYRAGNIAKAMFGWDLSTSIMSLKK